MNQEIKPTMRQIEEGFHSVYVLENFFNKMKASIKHSMRLHFHKYTFHHNGRFLLFDECMVDTYRKQIYKCCICGKTKIMHDREDDE